MSLIEVKYISQKKGKGVFATRDIQKNALVDIAHVVPILNKEYKKIKRTVLYNYIYIWEDPKYFPEYKYAITLSISQFINHSYKPNIEYRNDYDNCVIKYHALHDIPKGEELTTNYNGVVLCKDSVWFKVE